MLSKYDSPTLIRIVTTARIIVPAGTTLFALIVLIILPSCAFHHKDTAIADMLIQTVSTTNLICLHNSFLSKAISLPPLSKSVNYTPGAESISSGLSFEYIWASSRKLAIINPFLTGNLDMPLWQKQKAE